MGVTKKLTVLLADSYPIFVSGLRHILNREKDMECVGLAHDGAEAVRLAKELLPDIVIMDVMLPTINGAKAAKQIKSACPDTRIILLSTEKDNQYITDSMKAQVNGYLLKNASPKELITAIRMIYAGESVFNLEIVKKMMGMLATKWAGANTKKSPLVESNSTILNKEVKNG